MITKMTGTVESGALKLDDALPFPDNTRVNLTIEPLEPENPSVAAWQRVKERLRQRPVHGGGKRFTREELHERR